MVVESRNDLLHWINELLQLNLSKIEQLGTGAVYCQIMDSIYGDVPLSKVNFSANQEFQYVQNFKILQNSFQKHGISNEIPVERLVKQKFQDNLEFTQFLKKYWNEHYFKFKGSAGTTTSGSNAPYLKKYNSPSGNNALTAGAAHVGSPLHAVSIKRNPPYGGGGISTVKTATNSGSVVSHGPAYKISTSEGRPNRASINHDSEASSEKINELNHVIAELKITLEKMEKERDFYFSKLRELEILTQNPTQGLSVDDFIKQSQDILYSTGGSEEPEHHLIEESQSFVNSTHDSSLIL